MTIIPRRIRLQFHDAWSGPHPWLQMTKLLFMKVTTTFRRRVVVYTCLIDEAPPPPAYPPGVTVAHLDEENLGAYIKLRPDQSAQDVRARLQHGSTCVLAYVDGVIAAATWVATGRVWVEYLRGHLLLAQDGFYEFDGYTRPEYLGRKLFWLRNAFSQQYYREQGFQWMMGVVAVDNIAGQRALETSGYRAIGLYGCWRLGAWQRDWSQAFGDACLPPLDRRE